MELRQLYQFKEIAKYNNISKAAEVLHVTQPSLSTMLKKMESELGVQLFTRNHNKLVLSEAGAFVLSYVNDIQERLEHMEKGLAVYKRAENVIQASFCNKAILWYFVPRFNQAYPNIRLSADTFSDADDISSLLNREVDILITLHPIKKIEIECVPFLTDQHYFSIPADHELAKFKQAGIYIRDALPYGVIHYLEQENDFFCRQYRAYMAERYPQFHHVIYHDYFIYIQALQNSRVLSISTKLANFFRNDGTNRIFIPIKDKELTIQMYLCYRRDTKKKIKPILNWRTYADGAI